MLVPLTMRHARHGARWAIARFDDGQFALYRRGINGRWTCATPIGAPVRIILATVHPA
jgi:hypothetical protein